MQQSLHGLTDRTDTINWQRWRGYYPQLCRPQAQPINVSLTNKLPENGNKLPNSVSNQLKVMTLFSRHPFFGMMRL
jgi:hypothetical protein